MRHVSNSKRRGFTVIELLVALGIVVILAALLMPYFNGKRNNAKRASCQSNLKRIGLGFMQYIRDYDELYPLATTGRVAPIGQVSVATRSNGWADLVQPYVKSLQILQCPSEPTGASTDPNSTRFDDYFYNCALSWNGQMNPKKVRWTGKVSIAATLRPNCTIMVGDAGTANGNGTARTRSNGYASSGTVDVRSPSPVAPRNATVSGDGFAGGGQRHMGGINLCFADGHVKWYPTSGANTSLGIYNFNTSLLVSGIHPTFNAVRP